MAEEATAVAADLLVAGFTAVAVGFTVADLLAAGFMAAAFAAAPFTMEASAVPAFVTAVSAAAGLNIADFAIGSSSTTVLATRSFTIPTTTDIIPMGTTRTIIIRTDTAMDMDTLGSAIAAFAAMGFTALAFAAAAFTTRVAGATDDVNEILNI